MATRRYLGWVIPGLLSVGFGFSACSDAMSEPENEACETTTTSTGAGGAGGAGGGSTTTGAGGSGASSASSG